MRSGTCSRCVFGGGDLGVSYQCAEQVFTSFQRGWRPAHFLAFWTTLRALSSAPPPSPLWPLQGSAAESETFFSDLGVYLTLERAQRLYGFDAQRYGLGDAEAAQIAAVFARYDANDDGYLSPDEFRRLCAENRGAAGGTADLSEAEVTAAFELLDTGGGGEGAGGRSGGGWWGRGCVCGGGGVWGSVAC